MTDKQHRAACRLLYIIPVWGAIGIPFLFVTNHLLEAVSAWVICSAAYLGLLRAFTLKFAIPGALIAMLLAIDAASLIFLVHRVDEQRQHPLPGTYSEGAEASARPPAAQQPPR